jgi:uroporphyrin-III C-methyltransferase/precorrin-2 dehydrogenase/sirohydrochlorin ferrochelatase
MMRRSRKLSESGPARIAPMAVLPLFHKLADRAVLVVGGTAAVAWKLELLLAAGARPVLAADGADAEVADLVHRHGLPMTTLADATARLATFALVVADIADADEARRLHAAAVSRGIPINQIDRPALCTVQFGSIVNRSPVVVGISTDGAAPVLGQAIRQRLERMLPRNLGEWGEQARALRQRVSQALPLASRRRAWWARFAESALSGGEPSQVATGPLSLPATQPGGGRVTLVGAGPGDPDLLTVKAIRALQDADVVLFDALVSDGVLELARREAQRMPVGKRGGRPSCRQEEINRLMVRFASEGRHVVRLKAGDPAIFSRGGEEARVLRAAGIPFSIVPGVTTASAAAASLGVTLTDRHLGRQLLYVSGHGKGEAASEVDWQAVASGSATVALYMGRGRLATFCAEAMSHGAPSGRPVCIGVDVSRPGEDWIRTTLAGAAEAAACLDPESPCLILIGDVLRHAEQQTVMAPAPLPVAV